MTQVTVKELAQEVEAPVERLLQQSRKRSEGQHPESHRQVSDGDKGSPHLGSAFSS